MSNSVDSRAVISVDLDYFYAQCEEARDPSIKTKPVVICVFSGRTEDSGAVSTANYIARGLGVRSGMPIIFAKRILRDNSTAVFLPMDLEYYKMISERIMEIIRLKGRRFEQTSIDEAYLDVSSETGADYLEAERIGRSIKSEILFIEKMTCSIGIGPNKLVAKMAVDSKKPDGFTTIRTNQVKSFLGPLPVGKLFGVGPKTEEKLRAIGILTVGSLTQADPKILSDLLGKNLGPTLREMANGVDNSPVVERPIEQFSRIVTLKKDVDTFDFAEVLKPMAEDLSAKLTSSRLVCRGIGIIAITSHLKIKTRSRSISSPTKSEEEILNIASELFSTFFSEPVNSSLRIRRVGMKVAELSSEAGSSLGTLEDFLTS
jgi:DNA polymerase IV (archaeal DinB-like DNA polymerase)